MLRYYCHESNIKTLPMDRASHVVEPFQEAFEQVRDRFNPIPGLRRKGQAWAGTRFVRWLRWHR